MQTLIRIEVEVTIDHQNRFSGSPSLGMIQDAISDSAQQELGKLGINGCAMNVSISTESRP